MLWLVIRVALHTTFHDSVRVDYKTFMVSLLCDILEKAIDKDFSSELLFCMRKKIVIRLHKLHSTAPEFLVQRVKILVDRVQDLLQSRWTKVQQIEAEAPHWDGISLLDREKLNRDTILSLRNSGEYIREVLKNNRTPLPKARFNPTVAPRPFRQLQNFEICTPDCLRSAFAEDTYVALADIENSIHDNLDDWVQKLWDKCSIRAL
ncbi:hypothetical protein VKT23_020748 [Stygiomarasmius scandens]|uniref:Uncharacterized protein n=1 Tax=Marasmiellus scandens TaxID=2682957 RepID=A0ABR1ILK7_9AGAR